MDSTVERSLERTDEVSSHYIHDWRRLARNPRLSLGGNGELSASFSRRTDWMMLFHVTVGRWRNSSKFFCFFFCSFSDFHFFAPLNFPATATGRLHPSRHSFC